MEKIEKMAELGPVTGYYALESLMNTSVAGQDRLYAFVAQRSVGARNAQRAHSVPDRKSKETSDDRANRRMSTPWRRSCQPLFSGDARSQNSWPPLRFSLAAPGPRLGISAPRPQT